MGGGFGDPPRPKNEGVVCNSVSGYCSESRLDKLLLVLLKSCFLGGSVAVKRGILRINSHLNNNNLDRAIHLYTEFGQLALALAVGHNMA